MYIKNSITPNISLISSFINISTLHDTLKINNNNFAKQITYDLWVAKLPCEVFARIGELPK